MIDAAALDKARAAGALVFEPMPLDGAMTLTILPAHNTIRIYTWGDGLCCLPRGSTRAPCWSIARVAGAATASPDATIDSASESPGSSTRIFRAANGSAERSQ